MIRETALGHAANPLPCRGNPEIGIHDREAASAPPRRDIQDPAGSCRKGDIQPAPYRSIVNGRPAPTWPMRRTDVGCGFRTGPKRRERPCCGAGRPEAIALSEDPDIVSFLGNGFGLELLERHNLTENLARFSRRPSAAGCGDALYFDDESTLRDLVASFMLSERDCFALTGKDEIYAYDQEVVAGLLSGRGGTP